MNISDDFPLITVGIPFFNSATTLSLAIESVINQDYRNLEIILIDDGSLDESIVIANHYASQDSRIRVYSDGYNKGLSYRLNQIILLSKGTYVARMDSDDICLPDRLSTQLKFFLNDYRLDVLSSAAFIIDQKSVLTGIRSIDQQQYLSLSNFWSLRRFIFHPTVFCTKEWAKNNLYSDAYPRMEDLELWMRCLSHTRFLITNDKVILYREGNVNYRNYISSSKSYISFIYSLEGFSIFFKSRQIMMSFVKVIIYSLANYFGLDLSIITKYRNKNLSNLHENELNKIKLHISCVE